MLSKYALALVICFAIGCSANNTAKTRTQKYEKTKEPIAILDGNVALAFSPDSKWLAVGAELVDTSTWKVAALLEERVSEKNPKSKNHWGYTSVAFSPDSKKLALGDQDGTLRILEVPSMVMKQEVLAHGARLTGIGFASDNETIVTTSVDDAIRIRIWNSSAGKEVFRSASDKAPKAESEQSVDIVGAVDVFAISPNRELFAVADVMSKIVVLNVKDGKVVSEFKGPDGDRVEMDSLAFTSDSSKLLIGVTPNVHLYNLNGEAANLRIATKANSDAIGVESLDQQGLVALFYVDTSSKMPVLEFYDLAQSKSLGTFFPDEARGAFWCASADGKYIATTGRGGPIRIWNVSESMKDLAPLK